MDRGGFQHEALIYADAEEFLAATMLFLHGALENGEPALVAVRRSNAALLRGELGDDASQVGFADMEVLGRNPARIIPLWREFVDEHGGRPVRGIGEPVWPGRDAAEVEECRRHESLLNVAFSSSPVWSLLCPYDGSSLDDELLEGIAHSHETVTRVGVSEPSADYVTGADPFAGDLADRPPGVDSFAFGRNRLADVRRRVGRAAERAGFSASAVADLVAAASELAANSIVHGGGAGTLRVWRQDDRLVVELEDRGLIEQPLAGRLRPPPTQVGGRGLWLANQLCDLVQVRSGSAGTTIRLQVSPA